MEIKQLRHFEAVCRCGSFAKAAQECYISAQGIGLSISRLEDELGCKLLTRSPRGIAMTDAGTYMYAKSEQILKIMDECAEYFSGKKTGEREISIMFVRGTVERYAQKPIEVFKSKFPDVRLHLHVGTDKECEQAVLDGSVDIAVCAGPVDTQELETTRLYSSRNVLIVNCNHRLADRATVRVSDLRDEPLALMNAGMNSTRALFELAKQGGVSLDYSFVDDPRLAVYMAELDMRSGLTNAISASKLCSPKLCTIPFEEEEMDWNVFLISRKDGGMSQEAAAFRNEILGYLDIP